jgi:hypothetical protein
MLRSLRVSLVSSLSASLLAITALSTPTMGQDPAATPPSPAFFDAAAATALGAERTRAAAIIERAIETTADLPALRAATDFAAKTLLGHPRTRAKLERLLAKPRERDSLERSLEGLIAELRFEVTRQADVPVDWPPTTPVGEIVVKRYPQYRMAETTVGSQGRSNPPFFALFYHIQRNDIAMTAPVQMDHAGDDARRPTKMAFLYASPQQGDAGHDPKDERVAVVDVPPSFAVSIGAMGYESPKSVAALHAELESWLADHADRFRVAGPMRTMGYNSPMVPPSLRFYEVEIPLEPIPTVDGSDSVARGAQRSSSKR